MSKDLKNFLPSREHNALELVLVATAHLSLKQSCRICLWTILPGERASGRNHQFQTEELVPSIPKILSDVFLNSNTLVCLSLSTGTRLRWRSIATSSPFRKKKLTITFMIPLMADMAGPYEQTTRLKYYSGRFRGLEYRKLFCKMIPCSSGQKVRRWREIL